MTSTALVTTGDEEGRFTPAPMMSSEWSMIQEQAAIMARTEVVPKQYRGKPDDIIAGALMGRELGFGLATSLRLIDVIEGNPELNAEGKLALIRSRGHSVKGTVDDNEARLVGVRADNGDSMEVVFTWAEAERITFPDYQWSGPRDARVKTKVGETKLTDKDNWQNYRQDMLWSRAVSRLGRRLFGDVLQGFSYDRDEIETFTESDPLPQQVAEPIPMVRRAPVIDVKASDMPTDAARVDTPPAPAPVEAEPARRPQLNYIEKLLGNAGIESTDREGRHAKLSELLGRQVDHINPESLTKDEASKVIDALQTK